MFHSETYSSVLDWKYQMDLHISYRNEHKSDIPYTCFWSTSKHKYAKKAKQLLGRWVPICNKLVWIYFNYIFYVVQKLPENEKQNQFSNVSLNLTVTKYFLFSPSRLNAFISPVRLCLISILLIKRQKREKERKKPNRAAFRCLLCPQCVSVIYCSGSDSECVTHPKNQPPHPPAEIIHSYSTHTHPA